MKKELELSDIRRKLNFKTSEINLWWSVAAIIDDEHRIDFDVFLPSKGMNLQRPLCWTLEQKQQLIISIIKEMPIPVLAIARRINTEGGKDTYEVIDGKQRLSTIISFFKNEFPISVNGCDYFFNEMNKECQHAISSFSPRVTEAYGYAWEPLTDDDKISWFEQINFAGTPQDMEHMKTLKAE